MYVAGERGKPSVETTTMMEKIVRDQVINVLVVARDLATGRGQTKITTNDVLFQVRHDPERLARLQNYMRWKDIRKRARIRAEETTDHVTDVADPGADDDDHHHHHRDGDTEAPTWSAAIRTPPPPLLLPPWSLLSMFPHASDIPSVIAAASLMDQDDDDDEANNNNNREPLLLARLARHDEHTRRMTADEYRAWSDCRTASFTYRRKRAFAEWCGRGAAVDDDDDDDDVLEIVGFLAREWVQTLTERALAVKKKEEEEEELRRRRWDAPRGASAVGPGHVRKAFEMLQTPPKRCTAMMNGTRLRRPKRMSLRMF
ncbi:transcription initiation factor IID, 18kD subunit-domain-containing protein [Thermothelomyces heterothallicus CBS 202.75]|uniref:transcription initiation factor IID, 18kD subunit-domain-containing protein n=1 Tax=Thermothelomyces heterothallicus CBS 202.75 TaxID=1149848 RepID=UPI0037431762